MINDKAELLAEVVTRSGYEDIIPRSSVAIGLAEKDIEKRIRVSNMIETAVITLTNGVGILPSELLEIKEVRATNDYKAPQYSKDLIKINNFNGFYIEGNNIAFNPPLASVNLIYYKKIPSLNSNATNWLLELDPNIYITALMMQAFQMANDIESAVTYRNYLQELLTGLQADDNIKQFSQSYSMAYGVV